MLRMLLIGKESASILGCHFDVRSTSATHPSRTALFGIEVIVTGNACDDLSFAGYPHAL